MRGRSLPVNEEELINAYNGALRVLNAKIAILRIWMASHPRATVTRQRMEAVSTEMSKIVAVLERAKESPIRLRLTVPKGPDIDHLQTLFKAAKIPFKTLQRELKFIAEAAVRFI